MFVFWYCHKRGKEARLAREAEAGKEGEVIGEEDDGEFDAEVTDEEEADVESGEKKAEEPAEGESKSATQQEDGAEAVSEVAKKAKDGLPEKSESSDTTAPDDETGEKGTEVEAEKSAAA